MNIVIPKDVREIIDTFYKNGYEAFMVGGCIRDALLNKVPYDYDIATSAPPEVTEGLFKNTIPTGIKHGTITVIINKVPYEVTTYRLEEEYLDNRKPSKVHFVSDIKKDLSRRDFTVNAFAYNEKEGLVDFFKGKEDLNNKIIRCVGDADTRFKEDALRMLRAIRFSCQLGFSINKDTYTAIASNASLIKNISNERIRIELCKILLSSNAYDGINMLRDTKILNIIFPFDLCNSPEIDNTPKDLSCRIAALFINEDLSISEAALRSLTFDKVTINKSLALIKSLKLLTPSLSKYDCKKLIIEVKKDNIFNLIDLYEIINKTNLTTIRNLIESIIANNSALSIKDLNINGTKLQTELSITGKALGEILNHLLHEVMKEKIENTEAALLSSASTYIDNK